MGVGKHEDIQVLKPELPKGGGTIKGMGEMFSPHEFSGASSLSIPLPTSPCRGIQPNLSLEYSSGNRNSAFGMGWDLSLTSITRQTSKGIPTYDNDKDTFLFTGDDYLVKKFPASGEPYPRTETVNDTSYLVFSYIPRVEGNFSLIEHFINANVENVQDQFWKVTSADNRVHIFGKSAEARVTDPEDQTKIFKWLPEEVYDDLGNHCIYQYQKENDDGLTELQLELGRDHQTNVYLKRIIYGNDKAITDGSMVLQESDSTIENTEWHFEVILNYGQYNTDIGNSTPYSKSNQWSVRQDPFSSYDAGFEIRIWRLCKQVLLFHHFKELGAQPVLTDLLSLEHEESPYFSFVKHARHTGRLFDGKHYTEKSLPPLSLDYTPFPPLDKNYQTHEFETLNAHNAWDFQLLDLYGEGIPGLFYRDGQTVSYCEPELPLKANSQQNNHPQYSNLNSIPFPVARKNSAGNANLSDVTGNGKLDLVVSQPTQSGYYEMQNDEQWSAFTPFKSFPRNYHNPHNAQVDVTGDGIGDIVMVEQDNVVFNQGVRQHGYLAEQKYPREATLPVSSLSDSHSQTLLTYSDLLGTGSAQRVEITRNSVLCWPGLGYGKFGAAVALQNAPDFGDDFNTNRLHLADIDGSGCNDLIYVSAQHIDIYLNQSGNGFAKEAIRLNLPASWTPPDKIQFVDVKGNGTECLVFTKLAPKPQQWFYDFNQTADGASQRPHLLNHMENNLGASTSITYASSSYYYLKDKADGKRWITHLPFPVNVIASITNRDHISGTTTTSSYHYSHGYYDGYEREFRGFGYVARTDSHSFDSSIVSNNADEQAYNQAPVVTKSWYHTGAWLEKNTLIKAFQNEYWQPKTPFNLPDTEQKLLTDTPDEQTQRGVCRALHGTLLHSEVYGRDNTPWEDIPYSVSESQYKVIQLQQRSDTGKAIKNKYDVFRLHQQQAISWHYERNPDDPMVSHSFTLATDEYGHVTESASVNYGRLTPAAPEPGFGDKQKFYEQQSCDQQNQLWISYGRSKLINPGTNVGAKDKGYLLGIPVQSLSFDIKGQTPDSEPYFGFEELKKKVSSALLNHDTHELLSWSRNYYFDVQNQKELPLEQVTLPLLHHRSEHIVYDIACLKSLAENPDNLMPDDIDALLTGDGSKTQGAFGGYIKGEQTSEATPLFEGPDPKHYYWNPGASQDYFGSEHFYAPKAFYDPFQYHFVKNGASDSERSKAIPQATYTYDSYSLYATQVKDRLGNCVTQSHYDYIQLHAKSLTDANNNTSQIITDPLGMVIATAIKGQQRNQIRGFSVDDYQVKHPADISDIIDAPLDYLQNAASYFYYDVDSWAKTKNTENPTPPHSVHLNYSDYTIQQAVDGALLETEEPQGHQMVHKTIAYSDGFGRSLQSKAYCDQPQEGWHVDDNGNITTQRLETSWLTSGATVYNNKGAPIKQYEPFFCNQWQYQSNTALTLNGYSATLFYDALGRNVMVKTPDGFFSKTLMGQLKTEPGSPGYAGYLNNKLYSHLGTEQFNAAGQPGSGENLQFVPGPWSTLHYDANDCALMVDAEQSNVAPVIIKTDAFANTPHISVMGSHGKVVKSAQLNVITVEQNVNYTDYDVYTNPVTQIDQRLASEAPAGTHNFKTVYNNGIAVVTHSADAGSSSAFSNVLGQAIYGKDSRGFEHYGLYDELHRSINNKVINTASKHKEEQLNNITQRIIYCDTESGNHNVTIPEAQQNNLIGAAIIAFDESGMHISPTNSIAGVALVSRQWIKSDYFNEANWQNIDLAKLRKLAGSFPNYVTPETLKELNIKTVIDIPMMDDCFVTSASHNAIGQTLSAYDADGNSQQPVYDSLGREIALNITACQKAKDTGSTAPGTTTIEYNAKGQQTKEVSSNDVITLHHYDPVNFRLRQIVSTRTSDNATLQDLNYQYDPVGNVHSVTNKAQQTVHFNGAVVEAKSEYGYNSLYQLTKATGREQSGFYNNVQQNQGKDTQVIYRQFSDQKNNQQALQNYIHRYHYDSGGNLITQQSNNNGTSVRTNTISAVSNRMTSSQYGQQTAMSYQYDPHGNMRNIDGIQEVQWNYRDNISAAITISRPVVSIELVSGDIQHLDEAANEAPLTANNNDCEYYIYDGSGQRVRKISLQKASADSGLFNIHETLYAGGIEIRRTGTTSGPNQAIKYNNSWHSVKLMQSRAVSCLWRYLVQGTVKGDAKHYQQRFQLTDMLDSSNIEVDENALLITYEEYYPYGGTSFFTARNATEIKHKHYRYSSQEKDATGLYYYGMRYYSPCLGRWTTADPAGTVDGLNLYGFVSGNPVTFFDLMGMDDTDSDEKNIIQETRKSKREKNRGPETPEQKATRLERDKKIREEADQLNIEQNRGNRVGGGGGLYGGNGIERISDFTGTNYRAFLSENLGLRILLASQQLRVVEKNALSGVKSRREMEKIKSTLNLPNRSYSDKHSRQIHFTSLQSKRMVHSITTGYDIVAYSRYKNYFHDTENKKTHHYTLMPSDYKTLAPMMDKLFPGGYRREHAAEVLFQIVRGGYITHLETNKLPFKKQDALFTFANILLAEQSRNARSKKAHGSDKESTVNIALRNIITGSSFKEVFVPEEKDRGKGVSFIGALNGGALDIHNYHRMEGSPKLTTIPNPDLKSSKAAYDKHKLVHFT